MSFPEKVRLEIGRTAMESRVFDAETGAEVRCITAINLSVDANIPARTNFVLTVDPLAVMIDGSPVYEVQEERLKEVADRFGYDLVKRGAP